MKSYFLSCLCIVLLAACGHATAKATPTPTGLAGSLQAQLPTATSLQTPTSTPAGPKYCVVPNLLNLRSGPGTTYSVVTVLAQGTCGQAIARNADASWVYFITDLYTGWASAKYLSGEGDINQLPISKT